MWQVWLVGMLLLVLAACNMNIDAPQTPTVIVSPTRDETAVARLATDTPSATPSPTPSSTQTLSPTPTITTTATSTPVATTAVPTQTPTATLTRTPSPSATYTASSMPTATPTKTVTITATQTASITSTRTAQPSSTPFPTATPTTSPSPTPPIAQLAIPTATAYFTQTFTPFPTLTPNYTGTWLAEQADLSLPPPTRTPGGIYTLTPTATQPPTLTPPVPTAAPVDSSSEGNGTFFDPNAASTGQESVAVAPVGQTGPAGPPIPEQEYVVVSYAGQVVPLLTLPGGIETGAPLAQGEVFAVSGSGSVAAVGYDRSLYINGQRLEVSPSSRFGMHENLAVGDVVWSPDGQRLAFRVDVANPNEFNAIDSGIWIYEPASSRSWQIFRNTYQAEQLHDQRQAVTVAWAPNGFALVVTVETPLGRANVLVPVDHNVNEVIQSLPYADATWTTDSAALIVSGYSNNQMSVVGRIALDANWTYTQYLSQHTTGLVMQAALQLYDGRIAFLGASAGGSFALYMVQPPAAQPIRVSQVIDGQILSAEWNPERTAVLVTAQTGSGQRLWVVRTDGAVRDSTPTGGSLGAAHWR